MSQTALLQAPKILWTEAFNWATYLRNQLPHSVLQGKTPYKAMYYKRPTIGHLRPFYNKCFVTIPEPQRASGSKLESGFMLEPRALEGHLMGFIGKSLVRVYIPSKRRVDISRIENVRFVPADYNPSTSIEFDPPASISTSSSAAS